MTTKLFKIFTKTNPQKGSIFNVFFGNKDKEDAPDVGDKVSLFREDGRFAGFGRCTKNFDNDEKYDVTLCGGRETNLGDNYREIEVRG